MFAINAPPAKEVMVAVAAVGDENCELKNNAMAVVISINTATRLDASTVAPK